MAHVTILRTYAMMDPVQIPDSVKLCYSDTSVTVHDKWPKGKYHELVLPLIRPPLRPEDLRDLRSLLMLPREQAKAILVGLRRDALEAKRLVEEDMVRQHGFAWGLQIGFHALPSVEHLHLHIVSTDFLGDGFKKKRHCNSFHPTLGFFLDIDEVIRWFDPDIEPTWFAMKSSLDKKEYEDLLRVDMSCPHCNEPFKTMPKMHKHLLDAFQKLRDEEQQRQLQAILAEDAANKNNDDDHRDPFGGQIMWSYVGDPESGAEDEDGNAEGGGGAADNGLKRKHDDVEGGGEPEVIDVDALPEPSPAKKQQVEAGTSSA
ncbi:hypothetical protein BV20DRAFT_935176 [Pilatotrama ljubarskyi]|nr:hypothetical protein BV20DRAFT_935176 [Pilatotrama ljubarskyi]